MVRSESSGLKLGSESRALFHNITFRRCIVQPGSHRGINLQVLSRAYHCLQLHRGLKGTPPAADANFVS